MRYQVSGAKTLVLDPALAGPLSLLTEVSLLKVSLYADYWSQVVLIIAIADSTMAWTRCSGLSKER